MITQVCFFGYVKGRSSEAKEGKRCSYTCA